MKEIKAYIKPHKLSAVTKALHKIENLTGISVVQVKGFGRSRTKKDTDYIDIDGDWVFYVPHAKIEIVCLDEMVEQIVSTIQKAAHTGLRGDGKIYVSTVDEAIRIETGKRGKESV
jgi:nitrogen regulatory protein P-II 1